MKTLLTVMALSLLLTAQATAEPYWVSYEANDGLYPEEVGWERFQYGPPADRWFEDGALVIDGTASIETADFHIMQRTSGLDPEPGELFVAQWRLRVDDVSAPHVDPHDPTFEVSLNDGWTALLRFGEGSVEDFFNQADEASFSRFEWHSFELRTLDMRDYELWIDDSLAFVGKFTETIPIQRVAWGDGVQGAASISRWDYVRFGVVPEPGTGAGLIVVAALFGRALR